VIDRGGLLRGHDRMNGRDVRGREYPRVSGGRADSRRPGKGFEARSVEVGDAAETLPAADRHQRFELHLVGELRERERARPIRFQHAVDARDRAAAAEIGGERPQPQFAITEERIACLSQLPCPRIFPHSFLPMFKASDLTSDISVTQ
jgi:hypothetical protein